MKVVITGAYGQLGQTLLSAVPADVICEGFGADFLDLTAPDLADRLSGSGAQLVINAAAYTAVDTAETETGRARAFAVNALGAGNLAAACAELDMRLIHLSTDFVFDGASAGPYAPDAKPQPLNQYGASKYEGERQVLEHLPQALIVRTAWLYSRFGNNFVKTILRLLRERDELNVVCDQIGTPTWSATLAAALWAFAQRPALSGFYHYTDAGVASWYDFAVAIQEEAAALGMLDSLVSIQPITSAEYPLPAKRPVCCVLDKSATWSELGDSAPHWRVALRQMLRDLRDFDEAEEHG